MKHACVITLALVVFTVLGAQRGESAETPGAVSARPKMLSRFKIFRNGRPILLPVVLQGKTYSFLLDTGASHTTFDLPLEPLLGEPKDTMLVETSDKKTHEMHIYYAPDAPVGNLNLQRGGVVYCVDLGELKEVIGLDIKGVVGMGLLRKYAMQIDFDQGILCFFESDEKEHHDWGQEIPMDSLPNGVPFVLGKLLGEYNIPFLVDTGYGDTGTLSEKVFDHLLKQKGLKTVETTLVGKTSGSFHSLVTRMDEFTLGDRTYKGLIFDKGQKASVLGLGFLSRHKVTFDFPNSKLYLKKGGNYDKPDENDMSGLHLLKKDLGVFVHSVDKGLPAAMSGLKAKDILQKVNGQGIGKYTLSQIRSLLRSEDGKVIRVIFRREGKDYKTSFRLKRGI